MDTLPVRLLLADDDKDDCDLFKDALSEMPVCVDLITVHDGEKLMQVLAKTPDVLPDVLFLDLNMPRKNGVECLTEIMVDEKLKKLPVIIFSTSFDNDVVKMLYKNGAQHYIKKPNEFGKLKQVISAALSAAIPPGHEKITLENFVLLP